MSRFARRAAHARSSGRPAVVRFTANFLMLVGWPLSACFDAVPAARALAGHRFDGNFVKLFGQIYALALRRNVLPEEFVLYRFVESRSDELEYLYMADLPALGWLNKLRGADSEIVSNKFDFAELCRAHELPIAPTLAAFDGGRRVWPVERFEPSDPQLWIKALRGSVGEGVEQWTLIGAQYRSSQGRLLAPERLAAECAERDCIVQPRLVNHPTLAPLTNGGLATLRIVTGVDCLGSAQIVATLLALPAGESKISTFGVMCAVERESGVIRRAVLANGVTSVDQHPQTGAALVGFQIPMWKESLALACRAHEQVFARFAFLGWDIAVAPTGPLLLETNVFWFPYYHQILDGPLGRTNFIRLALEHLERGAAGDARTQASASRAAPGRSNDDAETLVHMQ